jgi:ectoine hydroxylase-related dioxygenase (phytanoyl-CoA dioxygenase family)
MTSLSTRLDARERAQYQARGYHFPLRAYSAEEATALSERFLAHWQQYREQLEPLLPRERVAFSVENHLFLRWVYEIVTNPRILDAVESVLGPNVMVWSSQWFPKFPHDKAFVSWHQDATYWGLTPPNVTTAWIALTESTPANGCMRVIPGTHLGALLPQRETYAERNMLSRGQEIAVTVDESQAVALELMPGEFSLHHVGIVHGSGPNDSCAPRIGIAVRYISPDVVQQGRERDMVMLVRGHDGHGHFDIVEPPQHDIAYGKSAVHAESLARKRRNLLPDPGGAKQ